MTRIAFLGLGAMGRRMAARLLSAGHELTVWNRTATAAEPLAAAGARVAASPRAAVDTAEVVISMLRDDSASQDVWLDDTTGAAEALRPDTVVIESGTVTPDWIARLDRAVRARGAALLDAPVVGSRPQAEAGQLAFLVGGEASHLARATPVLQAMGAALWSAGPVRSGAALKLAVNALFATQVVAIAEQLALLRAAGVDPAQALAVLRSLPVTSPAAAGAAGLMLAQDWTPQFPVDLVVKDLGYARRLAAGTGAALPLLDAVADRFEAARAAGLGEANLVAVARLYG